MTEEEKQSMKDELNSFIADSERLTEMFKGKPSKYSERERPFFLLGINHSKQRLNYQMNKIIARIQKDNKEYENLVPIDIRIET